MAGEEPLAPKEETLQETNRIDPNGPPQPVHNPSGSRMALTTLGCLTVGGIFFGLCGIATTRTAGVTRSSQLKWEERDRQIEAAYQQDQAADAKDAAHE
jgi:hypothetical protein